MLLLLLLQFEYYFVQLHQHEMRLSGRIPLCFVSTVS